MSKMPRTVATSLTFLALVQQAHSFLGLQQCRPQPQVWLRPADVLHHRHHHHHPSCARRATVVTTSTEEQQEKQQGEAPEVVEQVDIPMVDQVKAVLPPDSPLVAEPEKPKERSPQPQNRFEAMQNKLKWKMRRHKPTEEEEAATEFSYEEFGEQLDATHQSFQRNDVIKGKVVQVEHKGVFMEIGAKSMAWLPYREVSMLPNVDPATLVKQDEEYEVQIIRDENNEGEMTVSMRRIQMTRAWDNVKNAVENDETLEAEVFSVNRGGAMILLYGGLRGFLPGSHWYGGPDGGLPKQEDVGKTVSVKVLAIVPEENKIVVSSKNAHMDAIIQAYPEGKVVTGTVLGSKPYGVFVDIGGLSSLLHISQISGTRIEDIESVFQVGQEIKVMVIQQDLEKRRIQLSTSALEQHPGQLLEDPQAVFDNAEESGRIFLEKKEAMRQAELEAASRAVDAAAVASLTPFMTTEQNTSPPTDNEDEVQGGEEDIVTL